MKQAVEIKKRYRVNKMQEFNLLKYEREPIVIYGAGTFGEYTLLALRQQGIEPVCFCDKRKAGEIIQGVKVYSDKYILKIENPVVLLAVGVALKEVIEFFRKNGITNFFSIYQFVFEEKRLCMDQISAERRDIYYFKHLYRFALECLENRDKGMFSVDWVITEKCSLKCRECANLMQYYESPCNYTVTELQKNLDRLLEVAGKVFDLRVLGGEPFMNPALAEIIEKYLMDNRVVNITIYTNATIPPRDKEIQVLKHSKVKCQISNYGETVKNFKKFVGIMEKEGIRHTVTEVGMWQDLGRLEDRGKTEREMAATFLSCECNNIPTLLGDKIYRCPFSAHGRNLNAIPDMEEDRVHLCGSNNYIKSKLRYLLEEKNFDYACGYCNGRNGSNIEPAIQIEEPLRYKKCKSKNGINS